jgi:hypothetical protein
MTWIKRLQIGQNWFLIVAGVLSFGLVLYFANFPPGLSVPIPQIGQTVDYASLIARTADPYPNMVRITALIIFLISLASTGWLGKKWVKILMAVGMFGLSTICVLFSFLSWIAVDTTLLKEEAYIDFHGESYRFAVIRRITDGVEWPHTYILLKCESSGEVCVTLYTKLVMVDEQIGELILDSVGDALYFAIRGERVYTIRLCGDVVCLIPAPTPTGS